MPESRQSTLKPSPDSSALVHRLGLDLTKIKRAVVFANSTANILHDLSDRITIDDWIGILVDSGGMCYHCKENRGYNKLGPDHLIPMGRDGSNLADNIVASCLGCNVKKGSGLNFDPRKKKAEIICYVCGESTYPRSESRCDVHQVTHLICMKCQSRDRRAQELFHYFTCGAHSEHMGRL